MGLAAKKKALVDSLQSELSKAQGIVFVDFTGLTVEEDVRLRRKLATEQARYQVVKNTLMRRALEGAKIGDADKVLRGTPTGVVISLEDPITPAKLTVSFLSECDHLKIKGGVLDGRAIDAAATIQLSKMPSKQELQAQVVSLALSPGRNLVGQIKSPAGRIVGAIEALVEKLEA